MANEREEKTCEEMVAFNRKFIGYYLVLVLSQGVANNLSF